MLRAKTLILKEEKEPFFEGETTRDNIEEKKKKNPFP